MDEDASVGERCWSGSKRGCVQGAVGGDKPPLVQEPGWVQRPGRDGEAMIETALLDDTGQQGVPTTVTGGWRLVVHQTWAILRRGALEVRDELRDPAEGLVVVAFGQAASDLPGCLADRLERVGRHSRSQQDTNRAAGNRAMQ